MKQIDAVVAGHICIDIIPKFGDIKQGTLDQFLVPGTLVNVFDPVISTGGAVSNTGLVMFKLGAKVEFMSKVGDDLFGNAIIKIMKEKTGTSGAGISRVKDEFTSYTIVVSPPGIDRIFLHSPGTNNTFGYKDINFDIVKKAKLFFLGYPTLMRRLYSNNGAELVKIYRDVKKLSITSSLDVSLPDPDAESGKINWNLILKKLLPYVDIFLPSIEESCYMVNRSLYYSVKKKARGRDAVDFFSTEHISDVADTFLNYGARIVVLKCGHRGFYIRTQNTDILNGMGRALPENISNWSNRELWMPSYHIKKIASTTGAGDSLVAGFLVACLKGNTIEDAIKYANAVGAHNLRKHDAVSGVGTWSEVKKMALNRNKKLNQLKHLGEGWDWNKKLNIWTGPHDKI